MGAVSVEAIYRDYYQKISYFVIKKVGNDQIAEDIVSDVFLKITSNIDRFDPQKAAVSTWVYTIANNTVLDYYRTRKVHSEIPSENGESGALPESLVDSAPLDSALIANDELNELAEALYGIPERLRDIVILRYYQNLTLKEVAVRMGMSYANVKILHKKALQELKGLLGDI